MSIVNRISGCGRPSFRQILWASVFFSSLIASKLGLKHLALPDPARYLLALAPLAFGALYMAAAIRDMRAQMDELQLRIYLEAAAVTLCGMFIGILTYSLLQTAGLLGAFSTDVVLLMMGGLWVGGYTNAARRYR